MDIRRVRAFRAIVEAGGLTKAAGLLNLTPGALSKSMRQLEREVGKTLFAKHGRRLRLTEHGTLLYKVSAPLIEEHARVRQRLDASIGGAKRTLRLATFEVFSTHFLGALLASGLAEHPLDVRDMSVGELERAVADREVDAGITYLPMPRRGLTFRPVGEFRFHIYVGRGAFPRAKFDDLPFAVPMAKLEHGITDALAIDCWPYERVPRAVKYRLTSLESALALCRGGHCAVFLPNFLAECHNRRHPRAAQLVGRRGPSALGTVESRVHVVHRDDDAGDEVTEKIVVAAATALRRHAGRQSETS
ncbi:MAG: LysR family transcriptional regulator [Alphaproteobacteria bacterium]|nr:LysR family transcriptional regulator [Alphaproteobacteria bacterium]